MFYKPILRPLKETSCGRFFKYVSTFLLAIGIFFGVYYNIVSTEDLSVNFIEKQSIEKVEELPNRIRAPPSSDKYEVIPASSVWFEDYCHKPHKGVVLNI